ncbi:phosphatase PAP2 family protein [Candidatus Woesearchaeota archaeon]|nr:phosphatase PAP2 family protein [Candidatus Woesearchaeota archaeon]
MPGKNALRNLFWAISLLGTPFFYIPATAYFLKVNPNLAVSLIFILVFNEVVCGAVKFVYPKERPIPMPRNNFFQKYLAGSFPSVHTARITSFSTAVISFYTDKMLVLIVLLVVICVGYSRIYLKKHYFIDVLAGFLIGTVISILGLNIQF